MVRRRRPPFVMFGFLSLALTRLLLVDQNLLIDGTTFAAVI
jgi:hypothetical protein